MCLTLNLFKNDLVIFDSGALREMNELLFVCCETNDHQDSNHASDLVNDNTEHGTIAPVSITTMTNMFCVSWIDCEVGSNSSFNF